MLPSVFNKNRNLQKLDDFGTYIDKFIDNVFHDIGISRFDTVPGSQFIPPLNIIDKKDSYIIQVEVPGISKENIETRVIGNILIIKGEKKDINTEERYRQEISYGSFRREITLHNDIDIEKIEAKHSDGVLTITIPKLSKTFENSKVIKID